MALCFSFAQSAPASFRIIWGGDSFLSPQDNSRFFPPFPPPASIQVSFLSFCRRATSFFFLSRHSLFTTYNNRGSSHSLPILERVPTKNLSTSRLLRLQHRHRRIHKADISSSVIQQVGPSHIIIEPGWAFPFLATRRPTAFLSGKDQHLDVPSSFPPSRVSFHPVAHPSELRRLSSEDRVSVPHPPPVFPYSRHLSTSGPTANRRTQPIVFWCPPPSPPRQEPAITKAPNRLLSPPHNACTAFLPPEVVSFTHRQISSTSSRSCRR